MSGARPGVCRFNRPPTSESRSGTDQTTVSNLSNTSAAPPDIADEAAVPPVDSDDLEKYGGERGGSKRRFLVFPRYLHSIPVSSDELTRDVTYALKDHCSLTTFESVSRTLFVAPTLIAFPFCAQAQLPSWTDRKRRCRDSLPTPAQHEADGLCVRAREAYESAVLEFFPISDSTTTT